MNESERLADQLRKAHEGEAWHGPSWREVLAGVTREEAAARPVPSAHSMAELVAHVTVWQEAMLQRLRGESPRVTDEEDWRKLELADDAAWEALSRSLFTSGETLAAAVERFPAARLEEERPNNAGPYWAALYGTLQHALYHAGQAALLRKALRHG